MANYHLMREWILPWYAFSKSLLRAGTSLLQFASYVGGGGNHGISGVELSGIADSSLAQPPPSMTNTKCGKARGGMNGYPTIAWDSCRFFSRPAYCFCTEVSGVRANTSGSQHIWRRLPGRPSSTTSNRHRQYPFKL